MYGQHAGREGNVRGVDDFVPTHLHTHTHTFTNSHPHIYTLTPTYLHTHTHICTLTLTRLHKHALVHLLGMSSTNEMLTWPPHFHRPPMRRFRSTHVQPLWVKNETLSFFPASFPKHTFYPLSFALSLSLMRVFSLSFSLIPSA